MGKLHHFLHLWITTMKSNSLLYFLIESSIYSNTLPDELLCLSHFCRYGIIIQHPKQPLLLLKQSHNAHNLLFSKLKYIGTPILLLYFLNFSAMMNCRIANGLLFCLLLHEILHDLGQMVLRAILCSWKKSKYMPGFHLNY
jgi:hypothetical protein